MSQYVYVVTSLEMGWDCVCGVYTNVDSAYRSCFHDDVERTVEEMRDLVENGDTSYVVHSQRLEN